MKIVIKLDTENRIINAYTYNEELGYDEINEQIIEMPLEDFYNLKIGQSTWINETLGLHTEINISSQQATIKIELINEKQEILDWLSANDYKVNKFLLGEYTADDLRWTTYISERNIKLTRYNEIETLLTE